MDREGGCGCIGILVLALAVFGGYTLYQRYEQNSGGCGEAREWLAATTDRYNALLDHAYSADPQTATRADIRDIVDSLESGAMAQRVSRPPDIASDLNSSLVRYYGMLEDSWSAQLTGDEPPYSNAELVAAAREITTLQDELIEKCD